MIMQTKGCLYIGLYVTQYPLVLEYRILLQADNALASLEDHFSL